MSGAEGPPTLEVGRWHNPKCILRSSDKTQRDSVTTSPSSSDGALRCPHRLLRRSLLRTTMGSWTSSLPTMEQASAVESEVDRDMGATPCSTSVCQMSELRC